MKGMQQDGQAGMNESSVFEIGSKLMTITQLAEQLAINPRTIRNWVFENKIPFLKIGKLVRFDPVQIRAWLQEKRKD